MEEKTPFEKAIITLLEAVEVGRQKGAYSFKECAIIGGAIEFFTTKPEEKPEEVKPEGPVLQAEVIK
jgi:hypothetical protein